MAWQGPKNGWLVRSPFFALTIGAVTIGLAVLWGLKIQKIRDMKRQIAQVEANLAAGQELWRQFPPLGAEEKRHLQEAQERLLQMLPKDKDLPSLLQGISRAARDYNMSDVSFQTGEPPAPSGSASVAAARSAARKADTVDGSKAVGSFPLRLAFAGDYREIAYFLEALQSLPQAVRTQSLTVQRGVPLVGAAILLRAYYRKGDLAVRIK